MATTLDQQKYTYQQALDAGLAANLGNIGFSNADTRGGVGRVYGGGNRPASEVNFYSDTMFRMGSNNTVTNYNSWLMNEAGGKDAPQPESFWQRQLDQVVKNAGKEQKTAFSFYEFVGRPGGGRNAQVLDIIKQLPKKQITTVKDTIQKEVGASKAASRKVRSRRGSGGLLAKAPIPGTEGMATGLPILGEGGLGINETPLGGRKSQLG